MKHRFSILLLLLVSGAAMADTTISNNNVFCDLESSYARPYFYHEIWLNAAEALAYPQFTNHWRACAASGRTLQGHNEIGIPSLAVPHWGNHPGAQYWGIIEEAGNGGYTAFQIATNLTNTIAAPGTTFNGTAYVNETGWCSTSHVTWTGQGDIPGDQSDGQTSYRDGNNALTNFFRLHSLPFVDEWNPLFNIGGNGWSIDLNSGSPVLTWFPSSHPDAAGQLDMAINRWTQWSGQIGVPTNIYSLDINFGGGQIASTNHCTASISNATPTQFSFTFTADRLGMPFDVPDGVCTNNATNAFVVMPQFADAITEMWRVTNLPAGNYQLNEDGQNTAVLSSTQLAAGWNRFRHYAGWEWTQKRRVVNSCYDLHGVDHTTLAEHSAGVFGVNGWPDLVNFYSYSTAYFSTNSGQAIIADMTWIETNLDNFDAVIRSNAQPATHLEKLTLIQPSGIATNAVGKLILGKL